MGHRLSRIYTRTGDDGATGLADGSRVSKDSPRIEALGAIDELNSAIGLVLAHDIPGAIREALTDIQHELFDLGGEISIPGRTAMAETQVARLEIILDTLNSDLAPLREFILPGGSQAAALCHFARSVCRRAERRLIALAKSETVNPAGIKYLNRLSDLLFVMTRCLNREAGQTDVLWQAGKTRGGKK